MKSSRRTFLRAAGAALAVPTIIPASALGQGDKPAPSERINMGFIGIGNRGFGVMDAFLNNTSVQGVAVCDVYERHYGRNEFDKGRSYGWAGGRDAVEQKYAKDKASGVYKGCATYSDYRELLAREDIDAVMVATPDHWHGLITLEALRRGKDVYCEKPVTHFFAEGQAVYKEVAARKAIFTVGSQQRSDKPFPHAVNLVRNGLIGKITRVEVGLPKGKTAADGDATVKEAPQGYDFWCGPSPLLPFMEARHHWSWRWHSAYGRGQLMDWIGHHNDIAHWGLGMENSGPISVEAKDWDFTGKPEIYDTAVDYTVISKYEGDIEVVMSSRVPMGCKWIGEKGWVYVNRGQIDASNPEWLVGVKPGADGKLAPVAFDPGPWKAYLSGGHQRNFVDCVKSRKETVAPAENAHRSITPGHIAYVSHELGRAVKWDPKTETAVGDDEAQKKLMALPYRGEWKLQA